MRRLTVDAREFKFFVWPAVAHAPIANANELDTIVATLKKLKAISVEATLTEAQEEAGAIPQRSLEGDDALLLFEEAEYNLFKDKLTAWAKNVAIGVADEFSELLTKIKTAERTE